eukprot:9343-Heterococcus_DN1.PRE.4
MMCDDERTMCRSCTRFIQPLLVIMALPDTRTTPSYNLMCDQIGTYNTKEAIEQLMKYYSFDTV